MLTLYGVEAWISEISAVGSILHQRQQAWGAAGRFPLTGWVTHVAFSDVVDPLPGRLRLVVEDLGNSPFTAVRITAFVHAVVRLCAVRRWDQLHQIRGFPVIVLHLDNITERSAFAHAFFPQLAACAALA
uniref:Uncharacterized protein pph40c n=1 Tax=Pseudomonas savastanoi pv. phaseolicola TaxID=319 RepID=Q4LBL7_PSESH|nr:hypothetical protein [Pseudomonas savastanoi pv. phaseolicola]